MSDTELLELGLYCAVAAWMWARTRRLRAARDQARRLEEVSNIANGTLIVELQRERRARRAAEDQLAYARLRFQLPTTPESN